MQNVLRLSLESLDIYEAWLLSITEFIVGYTFIRQTIIMMTNYFIRQFWRIILVFNPLILQSSFNQLAD